MMVINIEFKSNLINPKREGVGRLPENKCKRNDIIRKSLFFFAYPNVIIWFRQGSAVDAKTVKLLS